ncbi:hypothetical protein [Streptomyces sp. NL15-2K]|nr:MULTISPECIES: hypothetical protein [Actinomycetes]WKX10353.1 hypothetical protein Q4V64_23730 [Kutzneria buriramensis]
MGETTRADQVFPVSRMAAVLVAVGAERGEDSGKSDLRVAVKA